MVKRLRFEAAGHRGAPLIQLRLNDIQALLPIPPGALPLRAGQLFSGRGKSLAKSFVLPGRLSQVVPLICDSIRLRWFSG